MTHKETLCWSCKRVGTGTCSWDKRLKPVDGWKAKQRPYPGKKGKSDHTYHVISCPRYVNDSEPTIIYVPKKLTDGEKEEVVRRLKNGETVASIARGMGRCFSSIRYYKKKLDRLQKEGSTCDPSGPPSAGPFPAAPT